MSLDNKLKIGFLSPISGEWYYLHTNKIEMVSDINNADYIIFESNGDPVYIIEKIKSKYSKKKLVFILSGDQHRHIDNECIWFSNAVKQSGLANKQYQIFVTNPAIFKYYDGIKNGIEKNIKNSERQIDIYFKGTIWDGMRTDMYKEFVNKPKCEIINNNLYWNWRLNSYNKPSQEQIEKTAYDSYRDIMQSKLCLCPKGNGNSSMRIIEALACGSIPILINDFSAPFGISWGESIGLVFDTKIHSWQYIYDECLKLITDNKRYETMVKKGHEYFENVIYSDSKYSNFKTYNDINSVCFGFSNLIINKLLEIKEKEKNKS